MHYPTCTKNVTISTTKVNEIGRNTQKKGKGGKEIGGKGKKGGKGPGKGIGGKGVNSVGG